MRKGSAAERRLAGKQCERGGDAYSKEKEFMKCPRATGAGRSCG